MNRVGKASAGLAGIVALVVIPAAPAFADDDFSFDGFFRHRLDSRNYDAGDNGYHVLTKTDASCAGEGNLMRVRLVENQIFGDKEYAWKLLDCSDTNQNRTWLASDDGKHHFTVEKEDTDSTARAWYIAGKMTYPD